MNLLCCDMWNPENPSSIWWHSEAIINRKIILIYLSSRGWSKLDGKMNSSTRINANIVSSEPKLILVNNALGWNIMFSIVSNPLNHVLPIWIPGNVYNRICYHTLKHTLRSSYSRLHIEIQRNERKWAQELKKQNKKHIDAELRFHENNLNSQIFNAHQNNFSIWILSIFKHKSGEHSRPFGI